MNFTGKVVLITGASSGIGAATAVKFAQLGATLSLTGQTAAHLDKTSSKCDEQGGTECRSTFTLAGDLTNECHVRNLMCQTLERFSRLDILVNNAGILETGTIESTCLEQLDRVFNVNVRSMYNLTMQAVPHLIQTKGNIVNVSSINGLRSFAGLLAYNMSKSAVTQFTQTVGLELGPKGVRVNGVCPGVIITELQKRGGLDEESYKKFLEKSKKTHPLGRPGEANEVADAIVFLASDKASFITSTLLSVDGGRYAVCPR